MPRRYCCSQKVHVPLSEDASRSRAPSVYSSLCSFAFASVWSHPLQLACSSLNEACTTITHTRLFLSPSEDGHVQQCEHTAFGAASALPAATAATTKAAATTTAAERIQVLAAARGFSHSHLNACSHIVFRTRFHFGETPRSASALADTTTAAHPGLGTAVPRAGATTAAAAAAAASIQ